MAHEVFISNAPDDRVAAQLICRALEDEGIECFEATRDARGDAGGRLVERAVGEARVLVLVLSGAANESAEIKRELEWASSQGKPVVPVRLYDVPLSKAVEFYLSTTHWLDASTPPLERHLAPLADAVRLLLSDSDAGEAVAAASLAPDLAADLAPDAPPTSRTPPKAQTWSRHLSKKAIASLAMGVLSVLLIGSILFGLIAVVLGKLELKSISQGRFSPRGRKFARIGIVTGWIGVFLSLVVMFITWYWDLELF